MSRSKNILRTPGKRGSRKTPPLREKPRKSSWTFPADIVVSDRLWPLEEYGTDIMVEEIETKKERVKILKLLVNWDAPKNEYRIGTEPLSTTTWHLNQISLGPEC